MSDMMNRKFLLARLSYYVLESRIGSKSSSLNNLYPFYNAISDSQRETLQIYDQLDILIIN